MKTTLMVLIAAYILICLVLYIFQRKLLYFPTPAVNILNEKEIAFVHEGITLNGWVINEGKDKAIIYYGGNAEPLELNIDFIKEVLPNFTVYLVNYRGYGKSEGTPTQDKLFLDALFVYDKLKDNHKSMTVIGRSLGSGVASYVASNRKVEKVVLITPYDSVLQVAQSIYKILPISWLLKDKYLSYKYAQDITAQTLILYGSKDDVIPPRHTENLMTYFNQGLLTALKVEGADHNSIGTYKEYVQTMKAFLEKGQ